MVLDVRRPVQYSDSVRMLLLHQITVQYSKEPLMPADLMIPFQDVASVQVIKFKAW